MTPGSPFALPTTSASPAVMMMAVASTAPDKPAARAKGTVRPSDMPITMSRTVSEAVKCFSTCGVCGIETSCLLKGPCYTIRGYCIMTLFDVLALEPQPMAHTIRDKKKLLNRVRRIQGQIAAVEKALDQEQDCSTILLTIAACRGAINSLMAEIIEGHIRFHVVDPDRQPTTEKAKAAQELIEVIKAYLK
jgi:FrmR/RcnR family transcriptional regulator, repressor of frmRAB operon